MLGLFLMVQAYFTARRNGYPREPKVPYGDRVRLTIASVPALLIPVVVLGSILLGVATPTEAAIIGVLAVIITGSLIYRELKVVDIGRYMISTASAVGSIFLIIAAAAVFGRVLTLYGAADALANWIVGLTTDPIQFLIGVNIVFLVLGCMVDTVPIILVFVPLIMPTVQRLGIDPIHFGVITVFNLLIGLITPPYGLTMFLLCRMAQLTLLEFWQHMWPIFLTMLIALACITLYPPLATWLPDLVIPRQ
jgi:C4-dicarboxylate transporter DctM subunit